MADWPVNTQDFGAYGLLSSGGSGSQAGDMLMMGGNSFAANAVWPTINLAIYMPIVVRQPATVTNMAWVVGAASGNVCAGIYNSALVQVCTTGSVVQALGMQVAAVTPVALAPGLYYLAMSADNITGTFQRTNNLPPASLRACGVAMQTTAFVLPSTATFATMTATYVPLVVAQTTSAL